MRLIWMWGNDSDWFGSYGCVHVDICQKWLIRCFREEWLFIVDEMEIIKEYERFDVNECYIELYCHLYLNKRWTQLIRHIHSSVE